MKATPTKEKKIETFELVVAPMRELAVNFKNLIMRDQKLFTVDENTFATNPGNVKLKPSVWIRYNKKHFLLLTGSLIVSIVFSFLITSWFLLSFFLIVAINIFYWRRKYEHFSGGDSNGGIVISTNPMLVAVTTNLSKGFGEYPVLKIIKYKGNKNIGDRIGTVALYTASTDETLPNWIDFHPIPIEYATNNSVEIKSAIMSYKSEQWIQIEERLKQVPKPYLEGLYKIKEEPSDWVD